MRLSIVGYTVYGIVVLLLAADILLDGSIVVTLIMVVFAIWTFMWAGIEIEKQKQENLHCKSVKLEDLGLGTYVIAENPYVSAYYSTENLFQYFMSVEYITGYNRLPIVVEIPEDKNNRYKLQVAMVKFVEDIEVGEGFKVKKDRNITKI